MKNLLSLFGVLLFSLMVADTALQAQEKQKGLEQLFSALVQNQDFQGSILIAESGKVVYEKAVGFADPSTKRLNTLNTQFPVGSVTKTLTATAILQLKEKGRLQITD